MKKYSKKHAYDFKQTRGKRYLLNPAIERNLEKVTSGELLELGCGDGFYSTLAIQSGYRYTGMDISQAMINKAKKLHPNSKFVLGSSVNAKDALAQKFDAVLISMLFPEFNNIDLVKSTLQSAHDVLKPKGTLYVGTPHPCFDKYMQTYLFEEDNVQTDFKGYYESSAKFVIHGNEGLTFEDHHWTLSDYINSIASAGFNIELIDECKPSNEAKVDKEYYDKRSSYPIYILIKAKLSQILPIS